MSGRLLAVALMSVGAVGAFAETPPSVPVFSAEVEGITVDVVVVDGNGHPVGGLTAADFTLLDDGKPQPILGFEARAHTPRGPAEKDAAPSAAPEAARPGAGRTFGFVIDDLGTSPVATGTVTRAIQDWLDRRADPRDEITLATTSGDAWWTDRAGSGAADLKAVLARVRGRLAPGDTQAMSEAEVFQIMAPGTSIETAVERSEDAMHGPAAVAVRIRDRWLGSSRCMPPSDTSNSGPGLVAIELARKTCMTQVLAEARNRSAGQQRNMFAAAETLARVSRSLVAHGRKALVFFSGGVAHDAGFKVFDGVADASRRANTAVYFIDAQSLSTLTTLGADRADAGDPSAVGAITVGEAEVLKDAARYVADTTGGTSIRNTNDLVGGLDRVAEESSTFYLLGYEPEKKRDGKWHKLQVKVAKPGLTVRARRGYYAGPPLDAAASGDTTKTPPSAAGKEPIPLRIVPHVAELEKGDTARVQVALEIDPTALTLAGGGERGKVSLDVLLLAVGREDGRRYPEAAHVEFDVEAKAGPWLGLLREMHLPAGVAQVRAQVRDTASGRIGTARERLEVPAPGRRALLTTLSDRIEKTADDSFVLIPVAHRTFPKGGRLYCRYEVVAHKAGAPLEGSYRLEGGDGRVLAQGSPKPLAENAGRIRHDLTLPGLPSGDYVLVLQVADPSTGESLSAREPFSIQGETARADATRETPAPDEAPPAADVAAADDAAADAEGTAGVLARAGRYSKRCEREFSNLIAEETYLQKQFDQGRVRLRGQRTLKSEVLFVELGGPLRWMAFRDVFNVDGKAVRNRDARLERLFTTTSKENATSQAQSILEDSARYNLGTFSRNFNLPTLALVFLHPDNQARFVFKDKGQDKVSGKPARVFEFQEKVSPAFIRDEVGNDLFTKGKVWLDEASGRLLKSEASVKRLLSSEGNNKTASDTASIGSYQVDIIIEFGPWRDGGIWVPVKMTELCQTKTPPAQRFMSTNVVSESGESIQTQATYTSYRSLDVSTTETYRPSETPQGP